MGKFSDIVSKAGTPKAEQLPEVWAAQFALLTEAFFPAPGKASGTFVTPKYSITVFSEGSALKAVVGARGAKMKFWVTLDGPEAVLEQIELCLQNGRGEWREAKDQD